MCDKPIGRKRPVAGFNMASGYHCYLPHGRQAKMDINLKIDFTYYRYTNVIVIIGAIVISFFLCWPLKHFAGPFQERQVRCDVS